jgi:hypothetical protein
MVLSDSLKESIFIKKTQNNSTLYSVPNIAWVNMWAIKRCCYTTVEFATAASQNGVCITQQMCHKVKDEGKRSLMFCLILNNMDVLMKGKFIL